MLQHHIHFKYKDFKCRQKRKEEWTHVGSVCLIRSCATKAASLTTKGNQCESAEANNKDAAIIVSDKFGAHGAR